MRKFVFITLYILTFLLFLCYSFIPNILPAYAFLVVFILAVLLVKDGEGQFLFWKKKTLIGLTLSLTIIHILHFSYSQYVLSKNIINIVDLYATEMATDNCYNGKLISLKDMSLLLYPLGLKEGKIEVNCISESTITIKYMSPNSCYERITIGIYKKRQNEFGFSRDGLFCNGYTGFFVNFDKWQEDLKKIVLSQNSMLPAKF